MGKKEVELYRCKNQHVTDAYDKAVFNICLQREKNGYKSFHLCGCEPGVGTTSVVMELAIIILCRLENRDLRRRLTEKEIITNV